MSGAASRADGDPPRKGGKAQKSHGPAGYELLESGALPAAEGEADSSSAPVMDSGAMVRLREMHLAPYIQLATALIGTRRRSGGNMFRHQLDTMAILMDYGYIDSVLLKASVVHDLIEDLPDFDRDSLLGIDPESPEVYKLVLEVTRRPIETKPDFLRRIREYGSVRAQVLKCADRISNMISLGYVTDLDFVRRYTEETAEEIYPIADHVDPRMAAELRELVGTRREYVSLRFKAGQV